MGEIVPPAEGNEIEDVENPEPGPAAAEQLRGYLFLQDDLAGRAFF